MFDNAPEIYVVSRPALDEEEISRFLKDEALSWNRSQRVSSAEDLCELGGRVCYMSYGREQQRSNTVYLKNIVANGHHSVLEHAVWSFMITGVTRSFSHQFVRHRIGISVSQLSQQYHEEQGAQFIPPHGVRKGSDLYEHWRGQVEAAKDSYIAALDALDNSNLYKDLSEKEKNRAIRSAARSLLPNCIETKMAVTANARALRNFLMIRGGTPGDLEMRSFSVRLLTVMKEEAPSIFADLEVVLSDEDGLEIVQSITGRAK
jgi:thymidylate synthase (FAD)